MNWVRISGLMLRYFYLYKRTISRMFDIFFWPVMDLVLWGFVSLYLIRSGDDVPLFVAFFLGALIFWDAIFRSSVGVAASFLEDVWTQNFLNLFASPLKRSEFIAATVLSSFLRVVISILFMILLAGVFYHFNLFTLGPWLLLFFANLLIMGWSLGIVAVSVILRFGQGAEIMAWAFAFLFQPISAVFYPVAVLPVVLQKVAFFVPASHVFEGMRELISSGRFSWQEFFLALGLNALYIAGAITLFMFVYREAKKKGRLARMWQ